MHQDLSRATDRLSYAVGDYRTSAATTVIELAQPVDVVDADLPVARLELVFRSPHVASVAVRDPADPHRTGLVTRPRFTAAMTGRLGFGRAILARRATGELADWAPMVVAPADPVSEVAVRAMERRDERRYDDVLVSGDQWHVASTADLVRSLSTLLAVRSLHDPLTGLMHRSMLAHAVGRRCGAARGTSARVVVALLDLRAFALTNSRFGHTVGDAVLVSVAHRVRAVLPVPCDVARTAGDEFAVAATLPGPVDESRAQTLAVGLLHDLRAALAEPPRGLPAGAWPAVHAVAAVSAPGGEDAEVLLGRVHGRLRSAKDAAAPVRTVLTELDGLVEVVDI